MIWEPPPLASEKTDEMIMMMNRLNLNIIAWEKKNNLNPAFFILMAENINRDLFQLSCCTKNKVTNKSQCF